jgi:hypothetical protein
MASSTDQGRDVVKSVGELPSLRDQGLGVPPGSRGFGV